MNHVLDLDFSKNKVSEPIIKGKNFKPREKKQEGKGTISPEREKGKIKRESTKLETTYD